MKVKLDNEELQDILSALSFFDKEYPDRKGSTRTRKAMRAIMKKLWKEVKKRSKKL